MSDERFQSYAPMWTSEKERYGLLEVAPGQPVSCLVFDLTTMAPMTIDDEDEVVAAVIHNMRHAGVRMLTTEETRPKPERCAELQREQDRAFYECLGAERTDATCRREGCSRGPI